MRKRKISGERVITSALVLLLLPGTSLRIACAEQSDPPPRDIAVYVRDFELSVAPAAAPDPPSPGYSDKQKQDLQLRSPQVQDYFVETLVETLRKQGYSSSRNQVLPGNGILLEGVFAELDQENRIRQAPLASGSHATKLTLYVGAFDQKSVGQPLYVEAPVQEPDPNYGPVITLNSYIPMAKYEIEKGITEEDVRRICGQIAADLTALLQRNPTAIAKATKLEPSIHILRGYACASAPSDADATVPSRISFSNGQRAPNLSPSCAGAGHGQIVRNSAGGSRETVPASGFQADGRESLLFSSQKAFPSRR